MTLSLVLTRHWFDQMVSGKKNVEYRLCCDYWRKRIWEKRRELAAARFSWGYSDVQIVRPIEHIGIDGCPYEGWDGLYYTIHLGPIFCKHNFHKWRPS